MIKQTVTVELNSKQIEELVDKLPVRDKIRLATRLGRETSQQRFKEIISKIDKRRKETKMSGKEIAQEIEKARKEFYARRR